MCFLQLTNHSPVNTSKRIYVQAEQILTLERHDAATCILLANGTEIKVDESPEEILQKIF